MKFLIVCDDWIKKFDVALFENFGRYREYDGIFLCDLF